MKVTIINKSFQTGGAAIASKRLLNALIKSNVQAKMVVFDQSNLKEEHIVQLTKSRFHTVIWWFYFLIERIYFLRFEKNKTLRYAFSPAVSGKNISNLKEIKDADIIHLNWFNQGFLSLKNIQQLIDMGKPIVWTLHDMWAFTGGCHYNDDCYNYEQQCGNCKLLTNPSEKDLSYKLFKKKAEIYKNANLTFVTCSNWMQSEAIKSGLVSQKKVFSIPNPIDIEKYKLFDKSEIRKKLGLPLNKNLILFGAANINDERKGLRYLYEALLLLKNKGDLELMLFGKNNGFDADKIKFKVHEFGLITDSSILIQLYQAADLFVLPSLQDNLPNTVMESLACGSPVIAFNVGGIPQMIDHKLNGYLAEYKSSEDLARGIEWILENNTDNILGKAAREKVLREFSEEVVAQKYIDLYQNLLNDKQS